MCAYILFVVPYCIVMKVFEFVRIPIFAGVGISCLDVDDAAFGKTFNIQPVAIFGVPEPSNTCKALREMF